MVAGSDNKNAWELLVRRIKKRFGKVTEESLGILCGEVGEANDMLLWKVYRLNISEFWGLVESNRAEPPKVEEVDERTEATETAQKPKSDGQEPPSEQQSTQYLFGWRDILNALGRANDKTERERIKRLNELNQGPIIIPGQGAQPKADRAKLVEWWNGVEERWEETQQRDQDRQATLQSKHDYGKDGVVFSDIKGGEKHRRKDRKQ